MLIPFGVFSAGAGNGAAAGSYELISTTILGSSTASVTFSTIDQTYKHLQIRMAARSDVASRTDSTIIRWNADTSSTRYSHYLYGDGSLVYSGNTPSTAYIWKNLTGATNSTTGNFGASVVDILDYTNTSKNKTYRALGGLHHPDAGNSYIALTSGFLISTTTISSLTLLTNSGGNFVAGSRFSLYGIKG